MYNPGGEYLSYIKDSIIRKPRSKIEVDGKTYTGLEHLVSFPKITHETEKMIGGFPAKTCEFEIYNLDGSLDLNGKEVQVYRGLDISDTKTVWVPMGLFYADGEDVTNNSTKRTIQFKGTDRTRLFDTQFEKVYGNGIIPAETVVSTVVEKICLKHGLSVDSATKANIISYRFTEAVGTPESTTDRQMISWIAELSGCIPIISRDGQSLVFTRPTYKETVTETGKTYSSGAYADKSKYKTLSAEPLYGPVNAVSFGHADYDDSYVYQDDTDIQANGLHEWQINDNPLVENDRTGIAPKVFAKIKGMKLYPFNLTDFIDDYLFDINDGILIKKKDGTHIKSYVLGMSTTLRIRSTFKAGIQDSSTADRNLAGSVKTDLKSVKLSVDHVNNQITALVKESAEKYSEFTQTAEGLEGKIADTEKNLKAEISATAESFKTTYAKTETVNGQIKGVTDQITSLSSQLAGLDNTIADKVSTEVTKETTIKILAGQVESSISGNYVTKASYEDDKDDWVLKTDYNTKLNQTDQSISAAVKRVSTLEEAGYITESQCSSLIDAQADKITLAVESNLKIGVRNILLDSECFKPFTPSVQGIDGNLTIDHGTGCQTPSGEYKKIVWTKSGDYGGPFFTSKQIIGEEEKNITKIKKDTQYTLSFYAKATTGTTGFSLRKSSSFPIYCGSRTTTTYDDNRSDYVKDSGGNIAISPDEWRKVVLVFKITSDFSTFNLWFSPTTTSQVSLEISSLKVEEGNIATDWSPSVEDTEKSVQAKIEKSVQAKIDMCVQKDENNKLTSAIAIEGNKISIKSDKFELTNDGEVTCKRVAKDSETGTETITKFKMTNATLTHIYQDKQIGKIGISMDSSGLFYETITAGDMCGVMLKANSGNGYQIAIDNSTFNVVKNKSSANITLSEEGLGFTHKSAAAGVAVSSDWSSGNIPENERLLVATTYGLIIMSDHGLYLCGNDSTWLCDTVRLGNYYNPDISGSGEKKPLYVNTKTGIIST